MSTKIRTTFTILALLACFVSIVPPLIGMAQESVRPPEGQEAGGQQTGGQVPGGTLGNRSDSELWRQIRQGGSGTVAGGDPLAGVLIQSEGDNWRAIRNGPLSRYGVWAMLGMVVLLALFYTLRGRIRIENGPAGILIQRFNVIERIGHWLTAGTFIVLAITGLNLLYGRYFLPDIIGKEAFATITYWGKWGHNWIAYGFMAGLVIIFVMWVVHNIPNRHDVVWLLKGGGLFSKGSHPPSRKFNAGQKIIFWITVLGGLSLSLSGWALLDPFQYHMFGKTFAAINLLGFNLPTDLTLLQEQQLATLWHAAVSLVMISLILAHIYIGSVGMEGAFAAMGSGQVDLNWAKEHHNLWVEEMEDEAAAKGRSSAQGAPAE